MEEKSFSLEDFEKHMNDPVRWWMEVYNWLYRTWNKIYHIPKRIKYFIQRGKRGWSDEDIWGLDYYLAKVISQTVRRLEKIHYGYPAGPLGKALFHDNSTKDKAWTETLGRIAEGFETLLFLEEQTYIKDGKYDKEAVQRDEEKRKQAKEKMMLLITYFNDLWD